MTHLKYKCKVNFVKLPFILIYLCLKLVFENATAGRNRGCCSVVNCAGTQYCAVTSYTPGEFHPNPTFPAFHKVSK